MAEGTWLPPLKSELWVAIRFLLANGTLQQKYIASYFIYGNGVMNRKSGTLVVNFILTIGLSKIVILNRAINPPKCLVLHFFVSVRPDLGQPNLCSRIRHDHPLCGTYLWFMIPLPCLKDFIKNLIDQLTLGGRNLITPRISDFDQHY